MNLHTVRIEPLNAPGAPLGSSGLTGEPTGSDLSDLGYVEEEFWLHGVAREMAHNADWQRIVLAKHRFTTRVLVRRPADPAAFSGLAQLEPLHPNLDTANSWQSIHPWLMRGGHAWVGVTHDGTMATLLKTYFPQRYAKLSLPVNGLVHDLLGLVSQRLHSGEFGLHADRVILSGWSATGSICRLYVQEGFLQEFRDGESRPSVSGVIIGISSGAAGAAGYPALSDRSPALPLDHPRRTMSPAGVPVFEVLSEHESETHFAALRSDSDGPGSLDPGSADPDSNGPADLYRLYQVAGTSHATIGDNTSTNQLQFRQAGLEIPRRRIVETPSDARMDHVVRAIYQLADNWITTGQTPPVATRFTAASVVSERTELARDDHGNVLGGVRTPWTDAPLNTYSPHSTPVPGFCEAPPWTPLPDPNRVAGLVGHMAPLPRATVAKLFDGPHDHAAQFARQCQKTLESGFLLSKECDELSASSGSRWQSWESADKR